jgi:hypothetical protein
VKLAGVPTMKPAAAAAERRCLEVVNTNLCTHVHSQIRITDGSMVCDAEATGVQRHINPLGL